MSLSNRFLNQFQRSSVNESRKADFISYCQSVLQSIQNLHIFVRDNEEAPQYTIGATPTCTFSVFQTYPDKNYSKAEKDFHELIDFLNLDRFGYESGLVCDIPQSYSGEKDGYTYNLKIDIKKLPASVKGFEPTLSLFITISIQGKNKLVNTPSSNFPEVTVGSIYNAGMSGFYQVVRRSGDTIYLQAIQAENKTTPLPDRFSSDKVIRRVIKNPKEVKINNLSTGYLWDIDKETYFQ